MRSCCSDSSGSRRRDRACGAPLLLLACVAWPAVLSAQDIEPRAYSNAPVGVNFLIAGYAYTRGGISFDPALPIDNEHLETNSGVFAYARTLDFRGFSGKFDVIAPYTFLSGSAIYHGDPVTREVDGFVDPRFRLSVNLYGAPALSLPDFAAYRQDLIIGASLQVQAPWGQYDSTRLVNLGTNRWYFKPELGVSKALGPWTLEATGAVTFFTDNTDFYGGSRREQKPLYAVRTSAIYNFPSGIWGSLDVTYFAGGRTTVNGSLDSNLQQNWRVGGTLAFPIDRRNSIKLHGSSGAASRTGNDFDLVSIGWQHRWGAGL